jgi:hypothetical protein
MDGIVRNVRLRPVEKAAMKCGAPSLMNAKWERVKGWGKT